MSPVRVFRGLGAFLMALPGFAQGIDLSGTGIATPTHLQRVSFLPEPILIPSARPQWIELHFQVTPGFHVNSHEPRDETLIPTALRLTGSSQIRVLKDDYPAGTPLRLTTGAGDTLSTYQDDFRVRLQIVAKPGSAALEGTLHYQACNAASCFPPRDLPFSVPLTAR